MSSLTKVGVYPDDREVTVDYMSLYWKEAKHDKAQQVSVKVFEGCELLLLKREEFRCMSSVMEGMHKEIKEKHKKIKEIHKAIKQKHTKTGKMKHEKMGFKQTFDWQNTQYKPSILEKHGFRTVNQSTICAVEDGKGAYEIVFLYWREAVDSATAQELAEHIFEEPGHLKRGKKNLRGQSVTTDRGDKTMSGVMVAYGSWDAYGSEVQGLGEDIKQVRSYKPTGKEAARFFRGLDLDFSWSAPRRFLQTGRIYLRRITFAGGAHSISSVSISMMPLNSWRLSGASVWSVSSTVKRLVRDAVVALGMRLVGISRSMLLFSCLHLIFELTLLTRDNS